jgi:hypothetical protein
MSLISGLLSLVSIAYPPAAPVIGILEKVAPMVEEAAPVIKAAISEGPSAFKAAQRAAPDLAKAIEELAGHVFGHTGEDALEKVTRTLVGHKMTPDDEQRWFERASGHWG